MKKIILIIILAAAAIAGFAWIANDNAKVQKDIYALLEKPTLTEEEKDRVNCATDPDFAKEGFVVLDDAHAEMFKKHFGHVR